MSATAGITPIKQALEERTYGNSKTFYPMPYVEDALFQYQNEIAYNLDNKLVMNVIATAQKHIDQGISFELCIPSTYTTKDLIEDYIYGWNLGLKTIYYVRTNKLDVDASGLSKVDPTANLKGMMQRIAQMPDLEDCESCSV